MMRFHEVIFVLKNFLVLHLWNWKTNVRQIFQLFDLWDTQRSCFLCA